MVRNININVYDINELNDSVKNKVLDEYRYYQTDYRWCEDIYDEFDKIMVSLGFLLDEDEPYFSGFASQGDGASFTGHWWGNKMNKEIVFSLDINPVYFNCSELRTVADILENLANKHLTGMVQRYPDIYVHENTMFCNLIEINDDIPQITKTQESLFDTACKQLAKLLYKALEIEHENLTSDESVAEYLMGNEYEFTEDGKAFP